MRPSRSHGVTFISVFGAWYPDIYMEEDAYGEAQAVQDLRVAQTKRSAWFIPGAIIAAGLLLAVSVYVVRSSHVLGAPKGNLDALRPVTSADHIIGNPNAPVIVIEYADIDSSFTKSFQPVMEQIMTTYGPNGKVAWVFRHFPLVDQYPNSEAHAEAAECASSLGTSKTFWSFIDFLQAYAPGDQQFDPSNYNSVAQSLGLDTTRFDSCMAAHTYQRHVEQDITNAIDIGASGSPYSVIQIHGQKSVPLEGSLPYDQMKKVLDQAIAQAK